VKYQPTNLLLDELSGVLVGGSALAIDLSGSFVVLIAAPFTPGPTLTLGDLSEATFQGYARGHDTAGWNNGVAEGGKRVAYSPLFPFQAVGSDSPNVIYGDAIVGSDSVTLLAAELFDTPRPMQAPPDTLLLTVVFGFDPAGNYGQGILSPP